MDLSHILRLAVIKVGRNHFKGFSVEKANVKIKLDMHTTEKAIDRAQYALDGAIMESMVPFMPMVDGTFIQLTRARSASVQGTGQVYAGAGPYGRYLYEGKVMVDKETGKGPANIPGIGPRYRLGAELKATERELEFNKLAHPDVQKEWFHPAKKKDLKAWVDTAQKAVKEG